MVYTLQWIKKQNIKQKRTAFGESYPVHKTATVEENISGHFLAAAKQQLSFFTSDRDGDTDSRPVDLSIVFLWYNSTRQCPVQVICCNFRCVNDYACSSEVCPNLQNWRLWGY